ncbi:MAG: YceI family protein [Bacteroidota bacterium]
MIHRCFCIVLLVVPLLLAGQTSYKIVEESQFEVTGTSTLSDWTVKTRAVSGTVELSKSFVKKDVPKKGSQVSNANIRVEVKTLDGGRGATMNDKILAAFQASEHPEIVYELSSATVDGMKEGSDKVFLLSSTGTLSMAGKSQTLDIPLEGERQAGGGYIFQGVCPLHMKDFAMEPPSAMFGQIIAGDAVKVHIKLKISE